MARRSESTLAFFALLLLLSLTLLYGCRAFDPQPPVINRAPQTYVTGGPAETTGTGFTRHMFWYGTDKDGEVVQFIYAITDSTVRDLEDGQNRDEEDDRFNPADDVTTLETNDERFVGWTTTTDSIFEFTVDRGPTSSKDMTFHIVAVDDRGAIDPTPARLYFFNNSLGNPRLVFNLFVDVGTGPDPVWELRWTGDHKEAEPGSPEGTDFPFAGFERRFRIDWEASSPNGGIIGYRYRVRQGLGEFIPASILGQKQWDPEGTSFEFGNTDPPSPALGPSCVEDASGCDPALVRFPSGNYNISVEVLDVALVESEVGTGDLDFGINYAPETRIVVDSSYPRFEVRNQQGILLRSGSIASGDTIPAMSTAFFQSAGYDKFIDELPPGAPTDSLCCDTPLFYDPSIPPSDDPDYQPLVEYQSRLVTVRREGDEPIGRTLSNTFSTPERGDTISFWVGPLDYTYESRTTDEHRRPDIEPDTYGLIGGFRPRVREDLTIPGGDIVDNPGDVADTLVVALFGTPFPENEIDYTVTQGVQKWFIPDAGSECGGVLVDVVDGEPQPEGGIRQFGVLVSVKLKFVGEPDQRDPLSPVKAWTFAIFSDKDPDNEIEDGRESRDLSFFTDSPLPNEWEFRPEDVITFWAPVLLGSAPVDDYHPDSTEPISRSIGCLVAKHLGNMTLLLHGRTTANIDEYQFYAGTRKSTESGAATSVLIGEFGRQSARSDARFWFFIGGLGAVPGVPEYYWPDF
jgi:hypothetical protein